MFSYKEIKVASGCDCWGRQEYDEAYKIYYKIGEKI